MEIKYKEYIARIWFSADVGCFYGEVLNAASLIGFQASTLESAKEAMKQAVELYLQARMELIV